MKDLIKDVQESIKKHEDGVIFLRRKLKNLKPDEIKKLQDRNKNVYQAIADNANNVTEEYLFDLFDSISYNFYVSAELYYSDLVLVDLDFKRDYYAIYFEINDITFEAIEDCYDNIVPALKKIKKIIDIKP